MNKKQKIGLIVILVLVILVVILIVFKNINIKKTPDLEQKEKVTESTSENTQAQLKELLDKKLINMNITKKQLEKILGISIGSEIFLMGNDSYIMEKPNQNLIKKYKLEEYVKKQESYAKRIQNEFLKEFKYDFGEVTKFEDQIHQIVEITTMYYGLYLNDLNELLQAIYEEQDTQLDINNITEKDEIENYKYKVMAMEILDQNFEVYKNTTNEKLAVDIIYRKNKPATDNELFSLLCNMMGITYQNASFDGLTTEARSARLEKYKEQLKKVMTT